jgi:phospholipase/carboxylesterase
MHGFAAPGDDLVPLAEAIDVASEVRFAFPEGPAALPPQYGQGRAWWMIDMDRLERVARTGDTSLITDVEPPGLEQARTQLVHALDELEAALAPSSLFIGGFSQGAMLACDTVLRSSRRVDGLVMLSGAMIAAPIWRSWMEKRKGLAVFMSHGSSDPVLPFSIADRLRTEFSEAGLRVNWQPFRGGHQIPGDVLCALGQFLQPNG